MYTCNTIITCKTLEIIISVGFEDFIPLQQTLTFDQNTTRQEVRVFINNDVTVEVDEDFFSHLRLENGGSGVIVQPDRATILIVDDDSMINHNKG